MFLPCWTLIRRRAPNVVCIVDEIRGGPYVVMRRFSVVGETSAVSGNLELYESTNHNYHDSNKKQQVRRQISATIFLLLSFIFWVSFSVFDAV